VIVLLVIVVVVIVGAGFAEAGGALPGPVTSIS